MILYKKIFNITDSTSLTGGVFIAVIIGVVFLVMSVINICDSSKYRLIPISDKGLYFSNFLSAFFVVIYLLVGEAIVYFVAYAIFPNPYDQIMIKDFSAGQYWFKFEVVIAIVLGIMLILVGSVVIRLLVSLVGDFLPIKKQTFATVILTLIVIWGVMVAFNAITANTLILLGVREVTTSFSSVVRMLNMSLFILLIWNIVLTFLNLYLLNRWSEATK
jgi:H+/Cl- antiporter ClcA